MIVDAKLFAKNVPNMQLADSKIYENSAKQIGNSFIQWDNLRSKLLLQLDD